MKYYLAIDIGASGGRHILAWLEEDKIRMEEIYRFENGMQQKGGKLLWDTGHLFCEIVNGMKKCKESGKIPVSMSIDTWAVDYALLDEQDRLLGDTYGYRDHRTDKIENAVYEKIGEKELYQRTGIQKQSFNTIYQLMAVKQQEPELLQKAKTFLMLPDYFQFLLTGSKASEYTNATSTQLVDPVSRQWDTELLEMLDYPREIFLPLQTAGTRIGSLKEEIREAVGFQCDVVLCASHDTASAVMAIPLPEGEGMYISSGTWSLMGVEIPEAVCDENSRKANISNEGGYEYRFRYLKNIMGLWMIQSVRHELGDAYSFAELCVMAEENKLFPSRVDVNDAAFLSPASMIQAVQQFCVRTRQPKPQTTGEIAAVIYHSLAECYGRTVLEIENTIQRTYDCIYVIGGGAKAAYLNQLTADATGKTVYAGPSEATAAGNIAAQMIADKQFADLQEARKCIYRSFDIETYHPQSRPQA